MEEEDEPWCGCKRLALFEGQKMRPNNRAVKAREVEKIEANTDQSAVGKHKGDDGGTFGVEEGVQESTQTRLRCFLANLFCGK